MPEEGMAWLGRDQLLTYEEQATIVRVCVLGVFIALSRVSIQVNGFAFNPAQVTLLALFLFYLTLDVVFALAFLAMGAAIAWLAAFVAGQPAPVAWTACGAAFFGGYALQFVGHAVERSAPVILKHPVQANLAAPFFTIVELFNLTGLRKSLFDSVRGRIDRAG
jgi:uncharacterized membrane protein YGL010W